MPHFVRMPPQQVVGQMPAWIVKQLPMTNFETVDRYVLRNDLQQYDPVVPLYSDQFMDALNEDDMQAHLDGMYRTPGVGEMNRYGFSAGVAGLSAADITGGIPVRAPSGGRPVGAPATAGNVVTFNPEEPIKDSTMLAVVGGSLLAVAASVALWAYFGKRK